MEATATPTVSDNNPLSVLLASPRGFCAGVERAIAIVVETLERYGSPVYVRHEIVHNRHVVDSLRAKGVVFVDELDEIVEEDRPVLFSAHGVSRAVVQEARDRGFQIFDATCPLVSKVHREADKHYRNGKKIILIGHAGHPEVDGTIGQLPEGAILLVESNEDAKNLELEDSSNLAFITQTTLSVEDTEEIVKTLMERFPSIVGPRGKDICYATTNRQQAVRLIAERCDLLYVLGSPSSSNSLRLVEVAYAAGAKKARLIDDVNAIDLSDLEDIRTIGVTAGASAPEFLVEGIIARLGEVRHLEIEEISAKQENVRFKMPRELTN